MRRLVGLALVLWAMALPATALEITFPATPFVNEAPAGEAGAEEEGYEEAGVSLQANAYGNGVSGDAARAFANEGTFTRNTMAFNYQAHSKDGLDVNAYLGGSYTDDPQLLAGSPMVQATGLFLEVGRKDEFDVRAGNVPIHYSLFSFTRTGDGLGLDFYPAEGTRVGLAAVRIQRHRPGTQPERTAYGLRLEQSWEGGEEELLESARLGLNGVLFDDSGGPTDTRGRVGSVDLSLRSPTGLTLEGEYATSSAPGTTGNAWRADARYSGEPWSLGVGVEEYSPSFLNLVASTASDLQRVHADVGVSLAPGTRLQASYLSDRNNLDGALPVGVSADFYRVGLSTRPWHDSEYEGLRPLGLSVGYRDFGRRASDDSSRRRTQEAEGSVFYNASDLSLHLGFRSQRSRDPVSSGTDRDDEAWDARASYRFKLADGWEITPALVYNNRLDIPFFPTRVENSTDDLDLELAVTCEERFRFRVSRNVVDSRRPAGPRSSLTRVNLVELSFTPDEAGDHRLGLTFRDRAVGDDFPNSDYAQTMLLGTYETRF